ncbi:hypothetical protein [Chryseobacterium koreense]|uniref:Uncharacterized protein n=1 Tax=Chryseobacterium koreense CCUG 49689 TaxID=1304281 RepID=A0A0J7IUH5_9FLAO|nr:hypothetical protein [Chryseobacterium koreense]KMQ69491.1 hypothetical protein ACM44_14480 [Chryseobacterium koreense CCUG 49689]MBB5334858.1 hypothetical protein [Chryseobacterium koreense]
MSTEKKYYNEFFKEITEQQVGHLNNYYINHVINGKLKKVEDISPNFFMGEYYLDSNENLQEKIQELCINQNQRWIFYTQEASAFGFTLWNSVDIDKIGNLLFKGKHVLDNLNRRIFGCSIDNVTGIRERSSKTYYNDNGDTPLLRFSYKADGSISYMSDVQDTWGLDGGWPMDVAELIAVDQNVGAFPWDEHPYFHSAEPYLPTSAVI